MTLTVRDTVLGLAFLLAFPLAIGLPGLAASGADEPPTTPALSPVAGP